jgi:hypothetical protein
VELLYVSHEISPSDEFAMLGSGYENCPDFVRTLPIWSVDAGRESSNSSIWSITSLDTETESDLLFDEKEKFEVGSDLCAVSFIKWRPFTHFSPR